MRSSVKTDNIQAFGESLKKCDESTLSECSIKKEVSETLYYTDIVERKRGIKRGPEERVDKHDWEPKLSKKPRETMAAIDHVNLSEQKQNNLVENNEDEAELSDSSGGCSYGKELYRLKNSYYYDTHYEDDSVQCAYDSPECGDDYPDYNDDVNTGTLKDYKSLGLDYSECEILKFFPGLTSSSDKTKESLDKVEDDAC